MQEGGGITFAYSHVLESASTAIPYTVVCLQLGRSECLGPWCWKKSHCFGNLQCIICQPKLHLFHSDWSFSPPALRCC